ncbi:MAG TPA: MFS transporter [Pirellulales bacterium]|nr:MFS transporter [Pirellulales bacterium]
MSIAEGNRCELPVAAGEEAPARAGAEMAYGWILVFVAAAAMVATLPGRTHGLGIVTKPLLADLKLEPEFYAKINLGATLIGAAFCLPCGMLLDRFGSRRVLTGVVLALAFVVATMSGVETWPALFLAVTLTRGFGQSMLSICSLTIVAKAFRRRIGLAMGVYSIALGLGFGAAGKLAVMAVVAYGWRTAWLAIGLLLLLGMAPLGFLLVKDDSDHDSADGPSEPAAEIEYTLAQALVSPTFWVFALATSAYGLISSGLSLFQQLVLEERGFGVEAFSQVLLVGPLAGMASNLLGGWFATRWHLNRLLAVGMVLLAASLAALPLVRTSVALYAYAMTMGLSGGIVTVSFFTVWRVAFGPAHLGKIQGAAQMLTVLASAVGPLLLACVQHQTGSYLAMFYLGAPAALVLGLAAWLVPLPSTIYTSRA